MSNESVRVDRRANVAQTSKTLLGGGGGNGGRDWFRDAKKKTSKKVTGGGQRHRIEIRTGQNSG